MTLSMIVGADASDDDPHLRTSVSLSKSARVPLFASNQQITDPSIHPSIAAPSRHAPRPGAPRRLCLEAMGLGLSVHRQDPLLRQTTEKRKPLKKEDPSHITLTRRTDGRTDHASPAHSED
eukprot:Selendium_serpulae@DN8352_c0_g1_i1.p1